MTTSRSWLLEWAHEGRIPRVSLREAFAAADILPGPADWTAFLDRLLLWLGVLAVSIGVILFFAFNWADLHRFAQLGLAGGLWAVSLAAVKVWGLERLAGQSGLVAAMLLTGGLLALIGQIYQTGAEAFMLFGLWAGLTLPWALVGRLSALWVLWLMVANLALAFYAPHMPLMGSLGQGDQWLLAHALLNGSALALWEVVVHRRIAGLAKRWPGRWIGFLLGAPVTGFLLFRIFDSQSALLAGLVWAAWAGGMLAAFLPERRDLFMVAETLLAGIAVTAALWYKAMMGEGIQPVAAIGVNAVIGGFLVLLAAAAGKWLQHLAEKDAEPGEEVDHG